tara:strand:+ start:2021 stop:2674 length:654 start_codon:yes stop_codon:yes gene_type:complete
MTTYPATFPSIVPVSTNFRINRIVGVTESIFTASQQVFQYSGEYWEVDLQMPPMRTSTARAFVAFLVSLRGYYGSFYLGDFDARTPLGTASSSAGTPLVNGASQTGNSLVIDGATSSQTGYLKAGDYIQIGSGSSQRLHMVVADANTDGSGNATLSIEPALRVSPADDTAITVSNTKGVFRLSSNTTGWDTNSASTYGISFTAREVVDTTVGGSGGY